MKIKNAMHAFILIGNLLLVASAFAGPGGGGSAHTSPSPFKALLVISEAPLFDFGEVVPGNTAQHVFTLSNQGNRSALIENVVQLNAPFSFEGGQFPGSSGTCGYAIAPGGSCTVVVQFAPSVAGSFQAPLAVDYISLPRKGEIKEGLRRVEISLTGSANFPPQPVLSISNGPEYDYGPEPVGLSTVHLFTVTNNGTAPASNITPSPMTGLFSYVGGVYPGTGGTCGSTLGIGESCTIAVAFAPTTTGRATSTIILTYTGSEATPVFEVDRPIIGTGSNPVVIRITNGLRFSCALYSNGVAQCWGQNSVGQIGTGAVGTNPAPPTLLGGITTAKQISAGELAACALLADATVQCWGGGASGQLGNGSNANSAAPVIVSGLSGVTALGSGRQFTCAVLTDGSMRCWGAGPSGELGNGVNGNSNIPVNVTGLAGPVIAAAHSSNTTHMCVIILGGAVQCWGNNSQGQLGNGTTTNSNVPVNVVGLTGPAVQIATGDRVSCALLVSGTVQCWGRGNEGQLGNGTFTSSTAPVNVSGLQGTPLQLVEGFNHFCMINTAGTMQCWGSNVRGELGDGTIVNRSTPVSVPISTVVHGSGGAQTTCTVVNFQSVQCWGGNFFNQLGNGTGVESHVPITVPLPPL